MATETPEQPAQLGVPLFLLVSVPCHALLGIETSCSGGKLQGALLRAINTTAGVLLTSTRTQKPQADIRRARVFIQRVPCEMLMEIISNQRRRPVFAGARSDSPCLSPVVTAVV